MVIHGVNREMLGEIRRRKRLLGIVSKGGSITSAFMLLNQCENPFIEHFDEVLSNCHRYDIVLSLANTTRSGCIHDRIQLAEIRQHVELAYRAHTAGVQVIIEGAGGHIRIDRIAPMVKYYKKQSPFPLFVAGPLPTDVAVGYIILQVLRGPVQQVPPGQITCAISSLPNIWVFPVRMR
jgi:phosphomethylpyrimidine synthase